ncbi:MAG: alcohol dehydrogenase catalytic domain-containing protein, partial [Mesorhizobium sp.]
MLAAWYERNGAAREVLVVDEMETPDPGPGEVRVAIHASGANPSDVKSRAGRPLIGPRVIPHSDGAGIIDAVGKGVEHGRIGERVWVWNAQWKRPFGTAAQGCIVPSAQAVRLPAKTSFAAGACLGIPALTALHAVRLLGPIGGRSVLVTG